MFISRCARMLFFLVFALAFGPFAAWGQTPACPAGSDQNTLVQPQAGPLCGNEVTAGSTTVFEYLGIPYAQPPVQNLRWKNPQPYPAWSTPRAAIQYGSSCPQPPVANGCNEDCLYLNVWVPVPSSKQLPSNLPVMVFIHGGAFLQGSGGSSTSTLDEGSELAARGNVIVVTLNYRLGSLGFLVNKNITDSTNNNFGFRDQILALQWVQANIGGFGGNAKNVTLFGESAGAMSVGLHALSSTQSTGLFSRVIMESNPLGLPYKTMTEAQNLGTSFANTMLCLGAFQKVETCMRNKTACELVNGELAFELADLLSPKQVAQDMLAFAPAIDDPQNPLPNPVLKGQPLNNAGNLKVPMILGTNRDEGYLFVQLFLQGPPPETALTVGQYKQFTNDLFGSNASMVQGSAAYGCSASPCTTQMTQILTDYLFTCANRSFAAKAPAANGNYVYQFREVTSNANCNGWKNQNVNCAGPNSFVCHGNELLYVFDSTSNYQGCSFDSGQVSVSNAMQDYWTSFASGKAPTTAVSGWPATWPAFQTGAGGSQYLLISESPSTASDPLNTQANCGFWDQIGYQLPTTWARVLASATSKNKK